MTWHDEEDFLRRLKSSSGTFFGLEKQVWSGSPRHGGLLMPLENEIEGGWGTSEVIAAGLAIHRLWRERPDFVPSLEEIKRIERAIFAVNGLDPNRVDGPEFEIAEYPNEKGGYSTRYTGSLFEDYRPDRRRYYNLQDYLDRKEDEYA